MDDSVHSLLQHEDTHPRDSAAPVQDSDVAVTKGNYQQTAPTAKMLIGPLVSRYVWQSDTRNQKAGLAMYTSRGETVR